jgi:hypothetical protein
MSGEFGAVVIRPGDYVRILGGNAEDRNRVFRVKRIETTPPPLSEVRAVDDEGKRFRLDRLELVGREKEKT